MLVLLRENTLAKASEILKRKCCVNMKFWTRKLTSYTILILPDLDKLERGGMSEDWTVPLLQAREGRPASGSSHSDAKILPLSTVRAHVNTMTSLRLPFK